MLKIMIENDQFGSFCAVIILFLNITGYELAAFVVKLMVFSSSVMFLIILIVYGWNWFVLGV